MGTGRPHVEITAATLAGGEKNQDRYAYGDGWAFVLDGASSFTSEQPEHDGGWYAERLMNSLSDELTSSPDDTTTNIVARAIKEAASAHDDPETCPTSTIAIARWRDEAVDLYVLGDSTVVLIGDEGEDVVTDSRLAAIAPELRTEYRSRLTEGHGFDSRHRDLLRELQSCQASARNQPAGYWIAGADPEAARHGLELRRPRASVEAVVLATDGAAAALQYGLVESWAAFGASDLRQVLSAVHDTEESDYLATEWPRSKAHDDKTAQTIRF